MKTKWTYVNSVLVGTRFPCSINLVSKFFSEGVLKSTRSFWTIYKRKVGFLSIRANVSKKKIAVFLQDFKKVSIQELQKGQWHKVQPQKFILI